MKYTVGIFVCLAWILETVALQVALQVLIMRYRLVVLRCYLHKQCQTFHKLYTVIHEYTNSQVGTRDDIKTLQLTKHINKN